MIPIGPTTQVLVMHEPVSFRSGIDGTVAVARLVLQLEPMDGALFVFRNRNRRMLRILHYDGSGYWLCTTRTSGPARGSSGSPRESGRLVTAAVAIFS